MERKFLVFVEGDLTGDTGCVKFVDVVETKELPKSFIPKVELECGVFESDDPYADDDRKCVNGVCFGADFNCLALVCDFEPKVREFFIFG